MNRAPIILFVHNQLQSFVATDLALLRERFGVQELFVKNRRISLAATWHAVREVDAVFCWFASWHSLVPVLFAQVLGKPSIVVVGGYDTANVPEAGYGSQRGGVRQLVAKMVMHSATRLTTFSHSAREEVLRYTNIPRDRVTVIHLAVPSSDRSWGAKERLVLTVGGVWRENLLRKGLLPFVQSAQYLPRTQFSLVGKWYDDSIQVLRMAATANVKFEGYLPGSQLSTRYLEASVYVQASLHEGFGMSVAEAMLAGCIPVVTGAGSLPEVVGDAGIYVASNSPEELATAIHHAMNLQNDIRLRARERIISQFPLEKRRLSLFALVGELLTTPPIPPSEQVVASELTE